MLKNVLGFHRVRVDDVMVPRADIVAVPAEMSLGELWGTFRTAAHSRLPVYGETLDDPKGMVHIRDFLDHIAAQGRDRLAAAAGEGAGRRRRRLGDVDLSATIAAAKILRPVIYVPRSMPALDLLVRMQTTRTHMALVIDEYGGTDGLVSIEDLVEAVVGDIEDEHDDQAARLILNGDGDTFVADARASVEEVSEALGRRPRRRATCAEDVDTLGGLVVTLAGRVPSRGELIAGPRPARVRDPRRRSAPHQAPAHPPARGEPRPSNATPGTRRRGRGESAGNRRRSTAPADRPESTLRSAPDILHRVRRRPRRPRLGEPGQRVRPPPRLILPSHLPPSLGSGTRVLRAARTGPARARPSSAAGRPPAAMTALARRAILRRAAGGARSSPVVAGAVGALAMPPFGVLPALAVSLTVAVWLLDGAAAGGRLGGGDPPVRRAGGLGLGLRLLRRRALVARRRLPGRGRPVRLGMPLRRARPAGRARRLPGRSASRSPARSGRPARPGSSPSPSGSPSSEWLRGHLFTGFPWNTPRHGARPEPLADAGGLRRRPLRPDGPGHPRLRRAGDLRHGPDARASGPARRSSPPPSRRSPPSAPSACPPSRCRRSRA